MVVDVIESGRARDSQPESTREKDEKPSRTHRSKGCAEGIRRKRNAPAVYDLARTRRCARGFHRLPCRITTSAQLQPPTDKRTTIRRLCGCQLQRWVGLL